MRVTAIFDIGKTNKKFILFDENFNEVLKKYTIIAEIKDDDGDPCDNLPAIENWIRSSLKTILADKKFEITAINFSTYGASFVHIDKHGKLLSPLYNYLKPYPPEILDSFYRKYGDEMHFAVQTSSPPLAMLNSGLQLYWLKYARPEIFEKVKWSLHLPQYFSYLFTGTHVSEYTSLGCHTSLWDFAKNDYHHWVFAEGIDKILAPIVKTDTIFERKVEGKEVKIGTGIHDSSAALLPYILSNEKPFLLISTGTWSISLNPFSEEIITGEDLKNDCLNFMHINGKTVRASRLLLGNEYALQTGRLATQYNKSKDYHTSVKIDDMLLQKLLKHDAQYFHFETISMLNNQPTHSGFAEFSSFEEAYHQLMIELVRLQVTSAERAMGKTQIEKIYVDGGFADNNLYLKLLKYYFPKDSISAKQLPQGSALGAAMIVSGDR